MIEKIISFYGLKNPHVISSLNSVPRHEFVDENYRSEAYSDKPLPIGQGQTMSQPYTVAFMTHLLVTNDKKHVSSQKIKKWRVLEVGTGSGYQAAVLSRLVSEVYTVEIIPELALKSSKVLKKLKYLNVHVKTGSGEYGWKEHAFYDGIMVTAGLEGEVPQELFDQLAVGGVIVAPVGEGADKMMTRYRKVPRNKSELKIEKTQHGIFHFVPFVMTDDTITS